MRVNATMVEEYGSVVKTQAVCMEGTFQFNEGEIVMEHNDYEFGESVIKQTPESIQLQTTQLAVKKEVYMAELLVEAIQKGAELKMNFMSCQSEKEAEQITAYFAGKLNRTYQKQEYQDTNWFEIVTRETDKIEFSAYYG